MTVVAGGAALWLSAELKESITPEDAGPREVARPVAVGPSGSGAVGSLKSYLHPIGGLFGGDPGAPPLPQRCDLDATLIITTVASPALYSSAMITVGDSPALYTVGDSLADATIEEIDRRQVTLRRGDGRIQHLRLGASSGAEPAPHPAGPKRQDFSGAVTALGDGRYQVDRGALADALENPQQFSKDVGIVPNFKDGQAAGYRVLKIRRGSVVGQLGVQRRDVITGINGAPATLEEALDTLGGLTESDGMTLEVLRNGQALTLEYVLE